MTVMHSPEGFLFGCDPELFVLDETGKPVPALMIPGTKTEPFKVKGGAVQRDGFAAEFNIDPVRTFADFNRNISTVMAELEKFLPAGYTLSAQASAHFDPAVFDAAPDDAKELGCSPDFDAWTGQANTPPECLDDPYMRCAAGHLHIGWTEDMDLGDIQHVMNCRDLVKQLDWWLGGWSVRVDTDATRRRLYGKAGACRYKPYGVEYRVLSNFWVTSRERRLAVWNRLQLAIQSMANNYIPDKALGTYNAMLVNSINNTVKDPNLEAAFRYPLQTTDASYGRSIRSKPSFAYLAGLSQEPAQAMPDPLAMLDNNF